MCGFCTETLGIDILEAGLAGIQHAEVMAGSPLALEMVGQDGALARVLREGPSSTESWPSALTLRCRQIEALVTAGQSPAPLVSASEHAIFAGWAVPTSKLRSADNNAAAAVLDRFARWWPTQNPEVASVDPSEWSSAQAARTRDLEQLLPKLWAAQAIAFRAPNLPGILETARRVAAMPLPFTPDMQAWDLWLQRRAIRAWHAEAGDLAIHQAMAAGIRPELVRYLRVLPRQA